MIVDTDRRRLLRIAREAIATHVAGSTPVVDVEVEAVHGGLSRLSGAFVTLHMHGELRGCIGHIQADRPLARVIAECAVAASSADPRFHPVGRSELADVDIELSILGPLEAVADLDAIEIGRDGLVVERGGKRGLLLPQVATEWNWDRKTFVEQTCHKAGLPPNAWQHGATLWKFEAEVFGEKLPTTES